MLKLLKDYLQAIMITNEWIYRGFLFVYNRYAPRLFGGYITQTSYDTQAVPSRTTMAKTALMWFDSQPARYQTEIQEGSIRVSGRKSKIWYGQILPAQSQDIRRLCKYRKKATSIRTILKLLQHIKQVKADVMPFIKNPKDMTIWSNEYFLQLAKMINIE